MPRRPIRLLDLMALVVAVALTLVVPSVATAIIPGEPKAPWDLRVYGDYLATLILMGWTVTLTGLALYDLRRDGPRVARRFGHAALFAAMTAVLYLGTAIVVEAIAFAWTESRPLNMLGYYWVLNTLGDAGVLAGAAVSATWLVLAIGRSGRRPSTWFDWLACAMGVLWILLGLGGQVIYYLPV